MQFFHNINKKKWPAGPWHSEADMVVWTHDHGFPCMARRNKHSGFWLGYIGVEHGHRHYGTDRNDFYDLEVHGGISYASRFMPGTNNEADGNWWLGFDCGHYMDLSPAPGNFSGPEDIYRTQDFVIAEIDSLADQLNALRVRKPPPPQRLKTTHLVVRRKLKL